MHKLITKKVIETIHLSEGRELLLRDTELKGFGIRISPSGTKTFFAEGNFNRSRQTKRRSLGRYPIVPLDTARGKARELLYQWYIGMDKEKQDIKTAQEAISTFTLEETINRYFSTRSLKSEADYRQVTRRVFGDWFDRPVRSLTREDIEKRYCDRALKKGCKAQTNKAMRYLNAILNFASAETINGTPLLLSNPVQVLSDKRYDRSVKPKKTFIEASQLSVWVNAVNSLCTPLARDLLLLQIQTGLRDSEAKGLLWEDVDFENRLFTVRNTKNGSDLTIPLSNQLYGLLLERKNTATSGIYVFPNKTDTGPVSSIRKQKDKVIGATGIQFTHHCLRRTFASLLNKELGIDIPTISILLNHTPQGVTQKHYLTSSPKDFRTVYQQLSSIVLKNEEAVSGN